MLVKTQGIILQNFYAVNSILIYIYNFYKMINI